MAQRPRNVKNRFGPIGDCHLCLDRQAAKGMGEAPFSPALSLGHGDGATTLSLVPGA
jgi:hypothetical protein